MGFWKGLACVAGAIGAAAAAPIVLPAIATAAATAGAAVASSAVGTAVASSAVGTAVTGAATSVAGAATAASGAIASSAVGTAVTGAASTVAGAATTAGGAIASSSVGTAAISAATSVASSQTGVALSGLAAKAGLANAGGLAAASIGGGSTYSALTVKEAFDNFDSAKKTIDDAKREYDQKSKEIDATIATTNEKLETLNKLKLEIYNKEVKDSLILVRKIKNTKDTSTDFFDNNSLGDLFSPGDIKRMEQGVSIATDLRQSLKKGASLMSTTTGLASQMVGQFGFASTGTAISSLSGAAAQRATLAALGGGSLASGGAGMLGGQIMLGGLSLVPTAVMMSWKMASNSEKALTEARDYHSQVVKAIENLEQQKSVLEMGISPRISELETCLNRLRSTYCDKVFPQFAEIVDRNQGLCEEVDFSSCSEKDKNQIALAVHFLKKMVAVMRVKVIDAKGKPNAYAKTVLTQIEKDEKMQEVS